MPKRKTATSPKPRFDTGFTPVMPLLPHERDETPSKPAPVEPVIAQAEKDLDRGLVDTDNYTRLSKTMPRGPEK